MKSNEDLGLGPDFSEVELYMSEDPFQMIYGAMGIIESRVQAALFDSMIEDDRQMEELIEKNIVAGALEGGYIVSVPQITISHPDLGDMGVSGEGTLESYGFYLGFDTCWFRSKSVYVVFYSLHLSKDRISVVNMCEEVESRLQRYSY